MVVISTVVILMCILVPRVKWAKQQSTKTELMGKAPLHIPKELIDALQEGRLVAMVCAGMSSRAGIPTWDSLLELMHAELKQRDPTAAESFSEARANGDDLAAGDIFKNSSGLAWEQKADFFRRVFLTRRDPTPEHLLLLRLGLAGIITTNYDHLLEDGYARVEGRCIHVIMPRDLVRPHAWQLRDFYIVKLHGDALDWESLVLGRSDYLGDDWSGSLERLLAGRTLLVLGYGGCDPRVNKLMERLISTCRIYVVQGQRTYSQFAKMMNAWDAGWPKRLDGVHFIKYPDAGGEHTYVVSFLEALRQLVRSPRGEVSDCEWGAMPPEIVGMDYPEAEERLTEFLSSGDRWCLLRGSPGTGVSSFAARWARNLAARAQTHVMRVECKEWLSLDIYVLFLLASTRMTGRRAYRQMRSENTGGWDRASEARALARAIDSSEASVVLVVEHPERLEPEAFDFFRLLLMNSRCLRIVFFSRSAVPHLKHFPDGRQVRMGNASRDSLLRLIQHYAPAHATQAKKVLSCSPGINAAAASLTGGLVQQGVVIPGEAGRQDNFDLLFGLLRQMAHDRSPAETIAKACAVVRTPRSVALVEALCGENQRTTSAALDSLSALGILMKDKTTSDVRYAMSTSTREKLLEHYFFVQRRDNPGCRTWTRGDSEHSWQSLNDLAGRFFQEELEKCGGESPEDIAPRLCMSLYHYQEAKDWHAYLAVVVRWRKIMLYHWHFPLLERLLGIIPQDFLEQNPSEKVELEYTLARIARVRSLLADYRRHLQAAEEAFRRLSRRQRGARRSAQLKFEAGILCSMERDYRKAVESFRRARYTAVRARDDETTMKAVARLAQACMSRGLYRTAARYLKSLEEMLRRTPNEHERAVLERHKATLSALRAQAMERAGLPRSDIEAELSAGRHSAAACYEISSSNLAPSYRPDESGMGIARLKMAQIEWYARKHQAALAHIPVAVGLLSGYPNSRWWRMCCHDVAARCHALLHQPKRAREHLRVAWEIFQNSCKTDIVRECELKRTEGLIALEDGGVEEALKWLESSLDFADQHGKDVPPILYSHLVDLARAYLVVGDLKSVAHTIERANNVPLIL
jgi:hypothetical protein